jgi:hypothetical protein
MRIKNEPIINSVRRASIESNAVSSGGTVCESSAASVGGAVDSGAVGIDTVTAGATGGGGNTWSALGRETGTGIEGIGGDDGIPAVAANGDV